MSINKALRAAIVLASMSIAGCASTFPQSSQMPAGMVIPGGYPDGYQDLCRRHETLCQSGQAANNYSAVTLTAEVATQLDRVNRETNQEVTWMTDREAFGKGRYWEIATNRGDCKAIGLRKLDKLLALGLPRAALKLATVWTETDERHLVLTVDTSDGTYVLDNRFPKVMPWAKLPYRFWSRENLIAGGWELQPFNAKGILTTDWGKLPS